MLRMIVAFGIVVAATAAQAEARPDAHFRACAKAASAEGRVKREDGNIRYTCFAKPASRWYNSLSGGRMVDDGPRGFFHSRYHRWDGYCAKHIKDADGTPREYFVCEVETASRRR